MTAQTPPPSPPIPTTTNNLEMPTAWREFAAGMAFLRRYGPHNTGNSRAIGKDNLRLLHRSLLQDAGYRQQLDDALQANPAPGKTRRSLLISNPQLSAQLISVAPNSHIRLTARADELGMLLILAGSLNEQPQTPAHTPSWRRFLLLDQPTRPDRFKASDILCLTANTTKGSIAPRHLSSGKRTCVILAVSTRQMPQPQPPATLSTRPIPAQLVPLYSALS